MGFGWGFWSGGLGWRGPDVCIGHNGSRVLPQKLLGANEAFCRDGGGEERARGGGEEENRGGVQHYTPTSHTLASSDDNSHANSWRYTPEILCDTLSTHSCSPSQTYEHRCRGTTIFGRLETFTKRLTSHYLQHNAPALVVLCSCRVL